MCLNQDLVSLQWRSREKDISVGTRKPDVVFPARQHHTQCMLSVKDMLLTTHRLGTSYNSQPKCVRFFSLGGDRLPWANLSQLSPESCWQVRAWCWFPVQHHLWVRMANQICPGIPVHTLLLIHSDTTKGDIFMLFLLRTLLFCLQSRFFFPHTCFPENSAKQFSISIFNSIYFSIYSAHLWDVKGRTGCTSPTLAASGLPSLTSKTDVCLNCTILAPKQTSLDLNTTLRPFSWHFKHFKWFCSPTTWS